MEKKSLQVNREDSLSPIPGTKIPFNEDEDIFSTIEEIHVPPAIRPSIQGVSKVIDPGYKVLRNRVVPSKEGNTQHNKEGVEEDTLIKWTPPPLIPSSQITSDVKVEGPFKEVLTAINGLTAVVQNLVHLQVTGSQKNKGTLNTTLVKKKPKTKEGILTAARSAGSSRYDPAAAALRSAPAAAARSAPGTGHPAPRAAAPAPMTAPETKKKDIRNRTTTEEETGNITEGKEETSATPWTKVIGRKAKQEKRKEINSANKTQKQEIKGGKGKKETKNPLKMKKKRLSRTAAVTITCMDGNNTYAEVLRQARSAISLDEIGIERPSVKNTITGGILLAIPGENATEKADILAGKLRNMFEETRVKIGRPTKKSGIKISGLEDSVTQEEIIQIVAQHGNCHTSDIRCSPIRKFKGGMGMTWLQVPALTAIKLTELGKLRIGWNTARIELLQNKPIQCYRCLARGHTRSRCPPENKDRSADCYMCGESDHKVTNCIQRKPRCPICRAKGLKDSHKVGSPECPPCPPAKSMVPPPTANNGREVQMEMEITEM
ncbi:uncharacterized protein [Linepithema humile]|uniref:uncharacterized protein isoform X1 n=1 Tax=Linepithema humile TaxID=83485 RepID=UPI00351F7F6B